MIAKLIILHNCLIYTIIDKNKYIGWNLNTIVTYIFPSHIVQLQYINYQPGEVEDSYEQ